LSWVNAGPIGVVNLEAMTTRTFESLPCRACAARNTTLCASLPDRDMHRLFALASEREYAAGEEIFRQEQAADHVYSLRSGHATIQRLTDDGRRQVLLFLFPGDFIGFTSEDRFHYSASAITPVRACRFERRALEDLIRGFPEMDRKLRFTFTRAADANFELLFSLGRKDAVQKVASLLWYVSYRQRKGGQPGNPVHLPMRRGDIADFMGLTTETVSRVFTQLRQAGVIRLTGANDVEIADMGRLREVALVVTEPAPLVHADPDYYPRKS
jgi:CRP/FNR family transcriptional regulator